MMSPEARYQLALALYEHDQLALAAGEFERVLEEKPTHVEARYKLGNVHKEQGRWDSAIDHYREVLRLKPGHAQALNNLGAAYQVRKLPAEAEACYRQAIEHEPKLMEPYSNLGRLLQLQGREREAATVYREALGRGLSAGLFGHLLKSSSGETSARAPEGYVRETFDAFAGQFDQHLVGDLGYRVPEQLAALVREELGEQRLDILDLGCGTGLVGEALAPVVGSLTGVDLSARMLEAARRRGCYHALHAADIVDWIAETPPGRFDLVIAGDVFIYMGDLAPLFWGAARVLRKSGAFAFSVECCEGADWRLLSSGRYAQSCAYLGRLAQEHGFAVLYRGPATIRLGVQGELYLLERNA
jgi:predicted TPR repeat methyltransferase